MKNPEDLTFVEILNFLKERKNPRFISGKEVANNDGEIQN